MDIANEEKKTPLIVASECNSVESVRVLLSYDSNPNLIDEHMRTALHYAAENNNPEIIRMLVEKNAETRIRDDEGLDPYDLAETRAARAALSGQQGSGLLSWCRI